MDDAYWDAFRLLTGAQQAYDRARASSARPVRRPQRPTRRARRWRRRRPRLTARPPPATWRWTGWSSTSTSTGLRSRRPRRCWGRRRTSCSRWTPPTTRTSRPGSLSARANASANAAALARVRRWPPVSGRARRMPCSRRRSPVRRGRARTLRRAHRPWAAWLSVPPRPGRPRRLPDRRRGRHAARRRRADRGRAALPGCCRSRRDTPGRPGSDLGLRAPGGRVRVRRGRADAPVAHGLLVAGVPGVPRGRRSRRGRQHLGALDPRHGAAGAGPRSTALRQGCHRGTAARRPRAVRHRLATTYRHVVIYLGAAEKGGPAWMLHTNSCGDVAKVEPFWGFPATGSHVFLGARRVLRLPSTRGARDARPAGR